MRFLSLATAALMAPAALGAAVPEVRPARPGFGCGTHEPTQAEIEATKEIVALEASGNYSIETRQTKNVDVYFHVVAASTALSDGYLTVSFVIKDIARPGN